MPLSNFIIDFHSQLSSFCSFTIRAIDYTCFRKLANCSHVCNIYLPFFYFIYRLRTRLMIESIVIRAHRKSSRIWLGVWLVTDEY